MPSPLGCESYQLAVGIDSYRGEGEGEGNILYPPPPQFSPVEKEDSTWYFLSLGGDASVIRHYRDYETMTQIRNVLRTEKICLTFFLKSLPAVGRCVIRGRRFFQSFLKIELTKGMH